MSSTVTDMSSDMDTLINDNAESIEEMMKNLDEIDFEGLNNAIEDLGEVVKPLADFFGRFK
jgi:Zn-dependent oligopeptidase